MFGIPNQAVAVMTVNDVSSMLTVHMLALSDLVLQLRLHSLFTLNKFIMNII